MASKLSCFLIFFLALLPLAFTFVLKKAHESSMEWCADVGAPPAIFQGYTLAFVLIQTPSADPEVICFCFCSYTSQTHPRVVFSMAFLAWLSHAARSFLLSPLP